MTFRFRTVDPVPPPAIVGFLPQRVENTEFAVFPGVADLKSRVAIQNAALPWEIEVSEQPVLANRLG